MNAATNSVAEAWSKGTLIAVCGIDGSGKSTLGGALAERLRASGHEVTCTRQPTEFYRQNEFVRQFHDFGASEMWEEGLALLSAADRLLHLNQVVVPALNQGRLVISDRYLHAAFAIFRARGLDLSWLESINSFCPPPHICVLLDCPGELAVERIRQRGGYIRLEERSSERLEAIRRAYLEVVPDSAIVLDALAPPAKLLDQALEVVESALRPSDSAAA